MDISNHENDFSESNAGQDQYPGDKMAGRDSEKQVLAQKENKAIWYLRFLVMCVLCCVALTVSLSVYFVTANSEKENFEQTFMDVSDKIVETFSWTLHQRFGIIDEFSSDLTAFVEHNDAVEWPFVTLPDYARRAHKTAVLADLFSVVVLPRVETELLEVWNNYSLANQGWRQEGFAFAQGIPVDEVQAEPIGPMTGFSAEGLGVEKGEGPYYPVWLTEPAIHYQNTNFNLRFHPGYMASLANIVQNQKPVLPASYDFWDPKTKETDLRWTMLQEYLAVYEKTGTTYDFDPVMAMLYPIFESLNEQEEKKLVAILLTGVYWKTYFRGILPTGSNGVLVILENSCNQTFTYRIDGKEARFLGHGDLHDPKYTHLGASARFNSILTGDSNDDALSMEATGNCEYGLRVYPSQEFEIDHTSNKPLIFSLSLAAIFVFTSAFFILYDYCVERRQKIVLKSALQSGALVSSLFPEEVRERLYAERDAEEKKKADANKKGWRAQQEQAMDVSNTTSRGTESQPSAIAQEYPECTMLFADIAGFTKWSSTRSPGDVFKLLETLYGEFDSIARRRKVFKIETIGDCYVAVTGLPKPQSDHAVMMAKFAVDCMKKLRELLEIELVDKLGEDTANLAMRFGLNSGPVTAGVIRGDKQRFQVFGDTVNTAARMESTGIREKIQVSESTANALKAAGKAAWVTPREDKVEAKGKGTLQTYWVDIRANRALSTATSTISSTGKTGSIVDIPGKYNKELDV